MVGSLYHYKRVQLIHNSLCVLLSTRIHLETCRDFSRLGQLGVEGLKNCVDSFGNLFAFNETCLLLWGGVGNNGILI